MSAPDETPDPATIARAFLRPRRRSAQHQPSPGETGITVQTSSGPLPASVWGRGFAVLLVHGWEGSRADMVPIAAALRTRYRVIAVDLPAHGSAPGETTSVPALADAIFETARAIGPVYAVVAHSAGAVATMAALARQRFSSKLAMLAARARYADHARAYAAAAGLDEDGVAGVLDELCALGVDVAAIDAPRLAHALGGIPALFVHSSDDHVVGIEEARKTAAAWPGAELIEVRQLGHQRLLRDPRVIQAVCDFLSCD